MPATASRENYCVCIGEDGAPHEIGRSGTAVTYKAIGYQTGKPVALQLIPLANVSDAGRTEFEAKAQAIRKLKHPNIARVFDLRVEEDHIVFATEYLEGETAEAWVVAHGPMSPDAVVRIGLEVVSALAEAAFHSLSHRAVQPSNLMIVNGTAPDGSWPFVKLLNFGLAGLNLYSEGTDELAPPIGAAFASPEQFEKGKVDFRSEIFSLGATMCFLLTGAVPIAGGVRKFGGGERALPRGAHIPRVLRRILRRMLRINPDERPTDPVVFTDELRNCLRKLERRIPSPRLVATPPDSEPVLEFPPRRRFAPVFATAALLLLFAAVAAVLLPERVRAWTHRDQPLDQIGVPVGVPENPPAAAPVSPAETPAAVVQNESPPAASAAPETSSPETPQTQSSAPVATTRQPILAQEREAQSSASVEAPTPPQIVSNNAEPAPPAEAPPPASNSARAQSNDDLEVLGVESQPTEQDQSNEVAAAPSPPPAPAATSIPNIASSSEKSARVLGSPPRRANARFSRNRALPPMRVGTTQARFVGTTREGKWILRTQDGHTVITPPLPDTNDVPVISHRKVRKVEAPPHALPASDLPPVVVLPPDG